MTTAEVELFQPRSPALPATYDRGGLDSWVLVASDVIKLATYICETAFVPRAYRGNAPATAAAILAGRELGLEPMTALRHVQVVEGSPSLSAEYKRARVLSAGHELDIVELNTTRCRVAGRRRNSGKPPLEITYTIEDARRAGLVKQKGAWETRPRRMLFARAATEVCDFLFADVTNGLPTAELLQEGSEDGFEGYAESPTQAPPATSSTEPAKPRTARRRHTPAQAPAAPAREQAPAGAAGTTATQGPPLPGEEEPDSAPPASAPSSGAADGEPDHGAPGTVTRAQLTAMWASFTKNYGFTSDDKAGARKVVEHLIGRQLAGESTSDLSRDEARTVLDTLANWQSVAEERGERPMDVLLAAMAASAQDQAASDG